MNAKTPFRLGALATMATAIGITAANLLYLFGAAGTVTFAWLSARRRLGYLFVPPWLTAILMIALLAFTALAWKNRWWGRGARIFNTLGTLAALGFAGLLISWKVLLPEPGRFEHR